MSDTTAFACTIEGMCCAAETDPIERAVRALPGVQQVVADAGLARLTVTYDTAALAPDHIVAQVERLGFHVTTTDDRRSNGHDTSYPDVQRSLVLAHSRDILTAICGLLIL